MKPITHGLISLILLWLPAVALAQDYDFDLDLNYGDDVITNYVVDLTVQPDSTLLVRETITYDFGYPGHGITRQIPYAYTRYGILQDNLAVDLLGLSLNGEPVPYETISADAVGAAAGTLVWQIGDPDRTVEDTQTYVIEYAVDWGLEYSNEYTELYWNAIGTDWSVAIDQATVTVHLPADSLLADYEPTCYAGSYGASTTCPWDYTDDGAVFYAAELEAYEGVTIDLALDPQVVVRPNMFSYASHLLWNNWSLVFIPGIILLWLLLWWLTRPIHPDQPLIPIYEVPKPVTTPSLAEQLMSGKVTGRGVTAELIELARTGHIEFIYDEKSNSVKTLKRTGTWKRADPIANYIKGVVFKGEATETTLASIQSTGYTLLPTLTNLHKTTIKEQHWLEPTTQRYLLLFQIAAALTFVAGGFTIVYGNTAAARHAIITGVVGILFSVAFYIARQANYQPFSQLGANIKQLLAGFKWFLRVTEQERVKFTQAPKLTPKLFEEYLPYAVAFGVEQDWVKQFEHILTEPPGWLVGAPRGYTGLYAATLALGRTQSSFRAPSNTGRSGGFGGGFAGGGRGGGGGGRW